MRIKKRTTALALALSVTIGSMATSGVSVAAPAAPTVLAGQFCSKADLGKVVRADNGATVKCTHVDGYNRWVVK